MEPLQSFEQKSNINKTTLAAVLKIDCKAVRVEAERWVGKLLQ